MVLILSLLGNSLVIAVLGRNRRLRTIINYFNLNMAVSDVLMPLFALPIRIKDIYLPYGQWLVNGIAASITCKFMPFAEETSTIVSVLTLEFIAVERFFSIVFPMKRQPINSKKKVLYPRWSYLDNRCSVFVNSLLQVQSFFSPQMGHCIVFLVGHRRSTMQTAIKSNFQYSLCALRCCSGHNLLS